MLLCFIFFRKCEQIITIYIILFYLLYLEPRNVDGQFTLVYIISDCGFYFFAHLLRLMQSFNLFHLVIGTTIQWYSSVHMRVLYRGLYLAYLMMSLPRSCSCLPRSTRSPSPCTSRTSIGRTCSCGASTGPTSTREATWWRWRGGSTSPPETSTCSPTRGSSAVSTPAK